jgi:uncharacterized membrane protein required for colicin V production
MQLLFNWFDFVTVIMIGVGVWVGRRRGMSTELLDLILWLAIVAVGGFMAPSIGTWILDVMGLSSTTSFILAYLTIGGGLWLVYFIIKRGAGEKLLSKDAFGGMEYYLGMLAGVIRFLCILLAAMAILHAPQISDEALEKKLAAQRRDLGEIYFPPFGQIQKSIFRYSLTGTTVKKYAPFLLLEPGGKGSRAHGNIYQDRQQLVDEAGGLK